jgi:hypothetical protein
MTQSARRGVYSLQDQSLAGGGPAGQGGSGGCDCNHQCCVPSAEKHYNGAKASGIAATAAGTTPVDGPNSPTLANRMAIEFYNAGTQIFEISNQASFNYGDGSGRPVQPNTPYAFNIGPASEGNSTLHYIACQSGTCDCRVTEVGG